MKDSILNQIIICNNIVDLALKAKRLLHNPPIVYWKDEYSSYKNFYTIDEIIQKGILFTEKLSTFNLEENFVVSVLSENHQDLYCTDFGTWLAGGSVCNFYTQDSKEQIEYKLVDTNSKVLISSKSLVYKLFSIDKKILKNLKRIFILDSNITELHEGVVLEGLSCLNVINYQTFEFAQSHDFLNERRAKIIYTSGTSGKFPKGAMITHQNICTSVKNVILTLGLEEIISKDEFSFTSLKSLSFLANGHIFQNVATVISLTGAISMYISERKTVAEDFKTVKPNVLFSVPLLYYKIENQIKISLNNILDGKIFNVEFFKNYNNHPFKKVLLKLMKKKILDKIGFSELNILISGGASLKNSTYDFFNDFFNLKINSTYGMTELSGAISLNKQSIRETSGKVIPEIDYILKNIQHNGYGDLWVKGKSLFKGYIGKDIELDDKGYFYTGDLVKIDQNGNFIVKGRKTNQVKMADGRFYDLEDIANHVSNYTKIFKQICLDLQNKDFPIALVTLGDENEDISEIISSPFNTSSEYMFSPEVLQVVREEIKYLKDRLEINNFIPLPKKFIYCLPFTEENNLITPTKKYRFQVIFEKHSSVINEAYNSKEKLNFFISTED